MFAEWRSDLYSEFGSHVQLLSRSLSPLSSPRPPWPRRTPSFCPSVCPTPICTPLMAEASFLSTLSRHLLADCSMDGRDWPPAAGTAASTCRRRRELGRMRRRAERRAFLIWFAILRRRKVGSGLCPLGLGVLGLWIR